MNLLALNEINSAKFRKEKKKINVQLILLKKRCFLTKVTLKIRTDIEFIVSVLSQTRSLVRTPFNRFLILNLLALNEIKSAKFKKEKKDECSSKLVGEKMLLNKAILKMRTDIEFIVFVGIFFISKGKNLTCRFKEKFIKV